jgi:transposase
MPKPRDYHLTEAKLAAIETAIRRDKRPEVRQRCTAIHLLHLGHKPPEVARMQAVSIPTIYGWIDRWWAGGVEGLANRPKSGRPLKTDERYASGLEEVMAQEPAKLGYEFAIWTADRLRAHMKKETGIDLSDSPFRALLQRKGYRYRRPKKDLGHLQDKAAKAEASEGLEELKKRSSETISGFSLWTKQR